ncbi:MAG: hypothetical protein Q9166_001240 [cf. Caloplaca sp. 2 TL-2023]
MLGWLSGAAQRGAAPTKDADDGSPWIDEPPDTPAPVFAARAFKTALFGTPHPKQSGETVTEQTASLDKPAKSKHSPRTKFTTPKVGHRSHASRVQRATPSVSPAKGILMTPGTATTRRKTVSFGSLETGLGAQEPQQSYQAAFADTDTNTLQLSSRKPAEKNTSQPSLAKESFKAQLDASKQRLSEHGQTAKIIAEESLISGELAQRRDKPVQSEPADIMADYTVDLTKPRSQSGQHWKAEFERYQKSSDREMKKVIQHGQHIKSYAEKKDIEATELQEKLKRELAKCATMETKVSKLATQLASGERNGREGSAEHMTLMNDLSHQTALAIRYKQKADRYRNAIQQQKSSSLGRNYHDESNETEGLTIDLQNASSAMDNASEDSELSALQAELRAFRLKLSIAKEKTADLEAANAKLTKNFLRVKDEMKNYDARRVRKETKLKEREERLVAEKNACEAKLKQLTKEHEDLLRSIMEPPLRGVGRELMFNSHRLGKTLNSGSGTQKFYDQTRSVAKGPAIDIWTTDTPNDTADMTPPAAEPAINLSSIPSIGKAGHSTPRLARQPTALPEHGVAVSEATHEALREIDRNAVSEYPSEPALPPDTPRPTLEHLAQMDSYLQPDFPSSEPTSAAKRMNDRRNTIPSPRPSMVNMASSVVKEKMSPKLTTGWTRDTGLLSVAGSRRSTVGSLPPDRAAAAKARLAQRKSLKEGRHS